MSGTFDVIAAVLCIVAGVVGVCGLVAGVVGGDFE